jgi:hypothetical protein
MGRAVAFYGRGHARRGRRSPYATGLRIRYTSATAIAVETGKATSHDETRLLRLTTEAAVSIATINAINGIDEKTATATATTHGTATFEPSASLYVETPLSSTVRSLTGTATTVATAVTGVGTKFLSELVVGDVIRSATKGASRVTAIASDTACTLVAALPGGDVAGEAFTCYENLIVRIAAEAPQRVNTISHNGLSVVVGSAWASNAAGVAIKLGGEIASAWYFVWLVNGTSGTGAILSSQRTRPYGVTGYSMARRLIGAIYNENGGDILKFSSVVNGRRLRVFWALLDGSDTRILNAGTQTAYTFVTWDAAAPPLPSVEVELSVSSAYTSAGTNDADNNVAVSIDGTNQFDRTPSGRVDNAEHGAQAVRTLVVPTAFGRHGTYYKNDQAANAQAAIDVLSWSIER